jgi:hypothetical protein
MASLGELLTRVTTFADVDPRSTPGFHGDKQDAEKAMSHIGDELADLHEPG